MRSAGVQPVVFGIKNLRAFFPLSPRGTSGERAGERGKNRLLSPALSSFFVEEREKRSAAGSKQTTCRTVLAFHLQVAGQS